MKFLGKLISGPFTIPSGIITTQTSIIAHLAHEIPELGVITTKSIGIAPRAGNREPILIQYAPGCFMNAVGLANPGVEAFIRQIQELHLPEDRFLLTSVFGKDVTEFVQAAIAVAPYSDGIELNLSCPHASGYGMAIGQDKQLVRDITREVKAAVTIPVIPKLTPNTPNIGEIARFAADGGADAICAINTVGPGYFTVDGYPVLTNIRGGMSGKGILPIGLDCVKKIAAEVKLPIIACGGISGAADVKAYQHAGAQIFGVGSALAGLTDAEIKRYFQTLTADMADHQNSAAGLLKTNLNMGYQPYRLVENRSLADDLNLLRFDGNLDIQPGQFVFAWMPEVGEKPFSVLDNAPLTLAVRQVGEFTHKITSLKPSAVVYFRGPYGQPMIPEKGAEIVLVSGGCGIAALYQLAKAHGQATAFIGARDQRHLFYLDQLRQYAEVHVATDDGSEGFKGLVTDLMQSQADRFRRGTPPLFFNCGPEPMIVAANRLERRFAPPTHIYNSIDYLTRCGVGVCGSCATPDGRRSCVEGPFLTALTDNHAL